MIMNLKKQNVMASLALLGSITWSMTTSACPANTLTTTYVAKNIGGTALCIAVKTNGVDADVGLAANFDLEGSYTGTTPWPAKFSSLALAVKPTSPGACGVNEGEDDDCDDMKEADSHENHDSNNPSNVLTSAAVAVVTLPPSGLVSCSRNSGEGNVLASPSSSEGSGYGNYYELVTVPGNIIVSLFSGTAPTKPVDGGLWTIKSTALDPLDITNPNYVLLKEICNTGLITTLSEPKDFVPNNLKTKISVQNAKSKNVGKTSLSCSLKAYQFTQMEGDQSLIADSNGMIGLPNHTEYDNQSLIPLSYTCQ